MNKNINFNFANISKEQSKALTTMVEETVANGFVASKSFTIVDLWNIRRRGKTTIDSRKSAVLL